MKRKIAIFGSGLSALYAHAACVSNGYEVEFFSDKPFGTKPEFFGPVKLNWIPEEVPAILHPIWLFSLGDRTTYLNRMDRKAGSTTFPENGREETMAYDPSEVSDLMLPDAKITLGKFTDKEIERISRGYAHSFVTFPLQQSKAVGKLVSYWIYLLKDSTSLSLPNMVIYNGTTGFFPWTRFSLYWDTYMWEYSHFEYPYPALPPRPNVRAQEKQIFDIAPNIPEYRSPFPKVTMVGRWARWSKSVLAQDAYKQADKILKELK